VHQDNIIKLAKEERFEDVFNIPVGSPIDKVRRRFMLMTAQHRSEHELCAAINKAWTTLRNETSQERLERMCRVGYTMASAGAYDEAIQHLRRSLTLQGDKNNVYKTLAACLNARAVKKADKAQEILKNTQSKVIDNIIYGDWF
jgi:predicted Zn-dependent protease